VRALVTGGAGFIGSHVVDAFLARGYEVVAVDDLSKGSAENLSPPARLEQLGIVDAGRLGAVFDAFRPTVVAHLAAQASVTASVARPGHDLDVNVRGTFNVCEAARRHRARVVFASTGGALYGDDAPIPTKEGWSPEPLSPYGASKLAGESYVATWGRLHDLPNVVLRLANIYGPRQTSHGEAGVVAIFSDRLMAGQSPTIYGDGSQTRDYLHVSDVARAFTAAAEGGRAGTYNVGRGEESTVLTLLSVLQEAAGTSLEPEFAPLRPGELQRSALDSGAIEHALGWRPTVGVADGLAETFRWYASGAPVTPEVS
jgi:UDP-glucose 4-epimerase